MRGKIRSPELAKQLRDFSGLRWRDITPTDVDGFVEFDNRLFVFFEIKRAGAGIPFGQDLALRRLCKAIHNPEKQKFCVVFIARHSEDNEIRAHECTVEKAYHGGQWHTYEERINLRDAIEKYAEENVYPPHGLPAV